MERGLCVCVRGGGGREGEGIDLISKAARLHFKLACGFCLILHCPEIWQCCK